MPGQRTTHRLDIANEAGPKFASVRNAGGHEGFSLDGLRIPVPNHREIAEGTARSIMQQATAKLGEEWWT